MCRHYTESPRGSDRRQCSILHRAYYRAAGSLSRIKPGQENRGILYSSVGCKKGIHVSFSLPPTFLILRSLSSYDPIPALELNYSHPQALYESLGTMLSVITVQVLGVMAWPTRFQGRKERIN